ncbi:hypothetical protein HMPREF9225_0935 [Peptoniphilus duerdenii ATCC BAA-1640]|uniref:Uncharacterized protein n=1 Tax=Peptoniphilus duerdenii ATCC BAA-1640 TaxID=862517 RepID=E0NL96_9FIRM|nr:hypothetical protein [Peptoniphilus duerdenii]EFM25429.1 hypothetical protein HMPREF9225_0935 [Peptoniphilus duerdenii ATCC BAA-1640]
MENLKEIIMTIANTKIVQMIFKGFMIVLVLSILEQAYNKKRSLILRTIIIGIATIVYTFAIIVAALYAATATEEGIQKRLLMAAVAVCLSVFLYSLIKKYLKNRKENNEEF